MMEEELEKVSLFFHGVLVAHGKVVAWRMFRQWKLLIVRFGWVQIPDMREDHFQFNNIYLWELWNCKNLYKSLSHGPMCLLLSMWDQFRWQTFPIHQGLWKQLVRASKSNPTTAVWGKMVYIFTNKKENCKNSPRLWMNPNWIVSITIEMAFYPIPNSCITWNTESYSDFVWMCMTYKHQTFFNGLYSQLNYLLKLKQLIYFTKKLLSFIYNTHI